MEGFNLFAWILLPASLHNACFLLPSFLSLPPFFHVSPLPAPLQPSLSLRKSSFFLIRSERAVPEKRVHRRPPRPLGSSRLLSPSLQPLFLELKIFLAGRRLVKSSWQQSIQSLPSCVVSNVPSALLTLGEQVFLLVYATLFSSFFSWLSRVAFEKSLLCSCISCQLERGRKWACFVGLINNRGWSTHERGCNCYSVEGEERKSLGCSFLRRGLLRRGRSFELKGLCAPGLKRDASGGAFEVWREV